MFSNYAYKLSYLLTACFYSMASTSLNNRNVTNSHRPWFSMITSRFFLLYGITAHAQAIFIHLSIGIYRVKPTTCSRCRPAGDSSD